MVDAGHWSQHVLPFTHKKQTSGVYAVQGSPTINAPILGKARIAASPKARIYPVGVNQAKDIIYARLTLSRTNDGKYPAGFIHLNKSATNVFVDGLTCEYGKEEIFRGELFTRYVCPPRKRNEPLDCLVYALAGRIQMNPRFSRIKENLNDKTTQTTKKVNRRKRSKFVGGFKT